jgi:DNA gyrase subunit A
MREDGTFDVEGQEQIDIDAATGDTATTDVNDVIDIANDPTLDNDSTDNENTDDDE